jgi:hypothetical protein
MRSTVDIYDSLDRILRKRAKELGLTYKEALNRALASGLHALEAGTAGEPYRVRAKACGFRPGVDATHLNRLADELEDEERFA